MSTKLTEEQFKQQLRLLLKPVKQVIVDLINQPVDSVCESVDNNVIRIDGMPLLIEGNEKLNEIENGSEVSVLSNGFWDTVSIVITDKGEVKTDLSRGLPPVLIYPDSVVYYISNGFVNCCYVVAMNREITMFPTVKYNIEETRIRIQDIQIDRFIKKLEESLQQFIDKLKVLIKMTDIKVDAIIEENMTDLILTFEDAIKMLPTRKFENEMITPEYVVDFFLKGIESIQYYQRSY